jgi:DegV family protein with EDD domain
MTLENRVHIVTDTAADIPTDIKQQFGIKEVKIRSFIGEREIEDTAPLLKAMEDGVLYKKGMEPRTSTPPPGEVTNLYEKLSGEIFSVHMMKSKSGTYDTVCLAAKQVMEAHPEIEIRTFESRVSMGLGLLAMEAARHSSETLDEIEAVVKDRAGRTFIACTFATLEGLYRGGRISAVQYRLGTMTSVKPIFLVNEDFDVETKQKGRRNSLERLIAIAEERAPLEEVAIVHAGALQEAQELSDKIKPFCSNKDVVVTEVGPVVATYGWKGCIGVCGVQAKAT